MPKFLLAATAVAAACLALPVAADPLLTPLNVSGKAPTVMRVSIVGQARPEVRKAVGHAARTVCRNAVRNGELDQFDVVWCSDHASQKAMKHYSQIMRTAVFTDSGTIVLSAR